MDTEVIKLLKEEICNIEMRRRCSDGGMIGYVVESEGPLIETMKFVLTMDRVKNTDFNVYNTIKEKRKVIQQIVKEEWITWETNTDMNM